MGQSDSTRTGWLIKVLDSFQGVLKHEVNESGESTQHFLQILICSCCEETHLADSTLVSNITTHNSSQLADCVSLCSHLSSDHILKSLPDKQLTIFIDGKMSSPPSFHREKSHLLLWQTRLVNSLLLTAQMLLLTKPKNAHAQSTNLIRGPN